MLGQQKFMLIGVGVAALALLILVKKKGAAADVGAALGGAVVDAAGGAVAGVAQGIGDQLGVPRIDADKCQECIANGDVYGQSLYCPAGTFIDQQGLGGVVAAGAIGIGNVVGVPQTSMTECERAKAEGRTLDASFACPAGDFLSYLNPFK